VVTKGAPDVLMNRSSSMIWNGKEAVFSEELRSAVQTAINDMASQALRTMAIAYKEIAPNTVISDEKEAETGLTLIGLEGMIDPPRAEVKLAVKECSEAGIKTIMITGDHAVTAKAIASQLGIY